MTTSTAIHAHFLMWYIDCNFIYTIFGMSQLLYRIIPMHSPFAGALLRSHETWISVSMSNLPLLNPDCVLTMSRTNAFAFFRLAEFFPANFHLERPMSYYLVFGQKKPCNRFIFGCRNCLLFCNHHLQPLTWSYLVIWLVVSSGGVQKKDWP